MDRDYRVVFVRGSLEEMVASQRAKLERQGTKGTGLPDGKLVQFFNIELEEIASWRASRPNLSVLEVTYHQLLAAPHDSAQRINGFWEGGWTWSPWPPQWIRRCIEIATKGDAGP